MSAPSLGEYIFGGRVFYINETEEYALIEGPVELSNSPLDSNGDVSSLGTTSTSFGSGKANTIALLEYSEENDAPYIISNHIDSYNIHSDWYIPSIDELSNLYNSNYSYNGFSETFYGSSSLDNSSFKILRNNGSVNSTTVQSTFAVFKYIRKQFYSKASISVSSIENLKIPSRSLVSFGNISWNNNVYQTQEIPIRIRDAGSLLVCIDIDMTDLNDDYEATPESIFGDLPNLVSVKKYNGNSWIPNGLSNQITLNTIENGVAYHLTFSRKTISTLTVSGSELGDIDTVVPAGESYFPYLRGSTKQIQQVFGRDLASIIYIVDIKTNRYYPNGGLEYLEKSSGYLIFSERSFTYKQTHR